MKQTESLKNNTDYRNIYNTGKSYANKYLVMYVKKNGLSSNRLGISVSKKVGNSVVRHRITRLVRESYRLSEDQLLNGLDIVVVARVSAKGKNYSEIDSALMHLIKLHKIGNKQQLNG
jgi:ribonuclease P protein component